MTNEATIQAAIRLAAAQKGYHLWRNNVGVLLDANGRPVRYGLANDSKKLNAVLKSADLLGWNAQGRFVSVECKPEGWVYSGTEHERAQKAWADLVTAGGGLALMISNPLELP